jgi:hypothetical protein
MVGSADRVRLGVVLVGEHRPEGRMRQGPRMVGSADRVRLGVVLVGEHVGKSGM